VHSLVFEQDPITSELAIDTDKTTELEDGVGSGVEAGVLDGVTAGVLDGDEAGVLDGVTGGVLEGVTGGVLDGTGVTDIEIDGVGELGGVFGGV